MSRGARLVWRASRPSPRWQMATFHKTVVFLGFGVGKSQRSIYDGCFGSPQVWTCNDWYKFYSQLKHPDRIYQIHTNWTAEDGGTRRCPGWVPKYNASGARVITTVHYDGLQNQELFDYESAIEMRGERFFSCTWAYMLHDAMLEGFTEIEMVGINPRGEYAFQLELEQAIKCAREFGVRVKLENEKEWNLDAAPAWKPKLHYGWRGIAGASYKLKWEERTDVSFDFKC